MRPNQEPTPLPKRNHNRRRFLQAATAAFAALATPGLVSAEAENSDFMIVECKRLPSMREDSKAGEYLPQRIGQRLRRFEKVYVWEKPHAQERRFNDQIAERLGAPADSIVYVQETHPFFRVEGPEQRCILPPENPKEVTKESDLDGPPGFAS